MGKRKTIKTFAWSPWEGDKTPLATVLAAAITSARRRGSAHVLVYKSNEGTTPHVTAKVATMLKVASAFEGELTSAHTTSPMQGEESILYHFVITANPKPETDSATPTATEQKAT